MRQTRYIRATADGWLRVRREHASIVPLLETHAAGNSNVSAPPANGEVVPLPEYLKVQYLGTMVRDYFGVSEGLQRERYFSVATGNLILGNPGYLAGAQLYFGKKDKVLTYIRPTEVKPITVNAFTDEGNPIKNGTYPIQIPDHPHSIGRGYQSQSAYAMSWFYLGSGSAVRSNEDRYLHPGRISAGCVTVDPARWTDLYKYLILCRSGNEAVGTLQVVD